MPHDLVGVRIHRGNDTKVGERFAEEGAASVAAAFLRALSAHIFGLKDEGFVRSTNIGIAGARVMRARRPIGTACDARCEYRRIKPEGRKYLAAVFKWITFRRNAQLLWHEGIASRDRLRGSGILQGLLWHWSFLHTDQRLPGHAIQNIEKAGLAGLRNGLARFAIELGIKQNHRVRRIVIPDIVMHFLEMPAVRAGVYIEREYRCGEQVVACAHAAVEVRAGIAGGVIQHAEFRIDCGCLPHRRPAIHPHRVVLRPGIVAEFAGAGHVIEIPHQFARGCVVSFHTTADTAFAAGKTGDHKAVVIQWRAGDRIAFFPAFSLNFPNNGAGVHVERFQFAVELADVDTTIAQSNSAAGPAATHCVNQEIQVGFVFPEDGAGVEAEGEDIVVAGDHVGHTVVDDW